MRYIINSSLTCPVCTSPDVRNVPFQYSFRGQCMRAYRCRTCGIIFIHPQPTSEQLRELYSAEYFEEGDFRCGHESSYCDPTALEHIANTGLLDEIKSIRPSGRFLEIGCAGGAFLHAARKAGYTVDGVEFSQDACRIAKATFGLDVHPGSVEDAHFPDESFDVVFMGDVIEHLPDPVTSIMEVQRILAAQGLLVLELPSQTNNLYSRTGFAVYGALGRTTTVGLPPYHLFEYRPRSLRFLLQRCGFDEVTIREGILSPRHINLRGTLIQRWSKKAFQYPNWCITRGLHVLGDCMTAYASKAPRHV